jgi:ribosomal protein L3
MAGRMGGVRRTIKNLLVVDFIKDKKELFLKGAVPGNKKGKLEIRI